MRLKNLAVALPHSPSQTQSSLSAVRSHPLLPPGPNPTRQKRIHGDPILRQQVPTTSAQVPFPYDYKRELTSPMPARAVATTTDVRYSPVVREQRDEFLEVPLMKAASYTMRITHKEAGIQTGESQLGNSGHQGRDLEYFNAKQLTTSCTVGSVSEDVRSVPPSTPVTSYETRFYATVGIGEVERSPMCTEPASKRTPSHTLSSTSASFSLLRRVSSNAVVLSQFRNLSPVLMNSKPTFGISPINGFRASDLTSDFVSISSTSPYSPVRTRIPTYPGTRLNSAEDGLTLRSSETPASKGLTRGSSTLRELQGSPLAAVHRQRQENQKNRTVTIASPTPSPETSSTYLEGEQSLRQSDIYPSQKQAHFAASPLARSVNRHNASPLMTSSKHTPARTLMSNKAELGSPKQPISTFETTRTLRSLDGTPFYTPAPIPTPKKFDLNQVVKWNLMLEDLRKKSDHQDCRVPHAILVALQNEVLDVLRDIELVPVFFVQSVLNGSKAPPLAPLSNRSSRGNNSLLFCEKEITSMARKLRIIDDVLAESCVAFFERFQDLRGTPINTNGTSREQIDQFLSDVGRGPTGGRKTIGNPVVTCDQFPVAIFGTGKFDPSFRKNFRPPPKSGAGQWTTLCTAVLPIRVSVCFKSPSLQASELDEVEERYIGEVADLLGRMCSDWRCHRMRLFLNEAQRFQIFLPLISRMPAAELVAQGWGDMKFDGGNVIRWKTIQGGVILAFIAGVAEANVDEAMALVNDGDNHKNWIPFLSRTSRCFSVTPYQFVFSYGVNLPWPLSKRELVFMGMATDALLISPLHAIQMWGFNVPEVATTMFGIPCPEKSSSDVTAMEMPILSFSLSPMGPRKCYVMMVAVMDVKINFLPQSVQNYMAKHMATKMFGNVQRLCRDFEKSPYKKVLEENRESIDLLMANVPAAQRQFKPPRV